MKARGKKITIDMLVDYLEDRLDPDLTRLVTERLPKDPEGQSFCEWLHHYTPALQDALSTRELQPSAEAVSAVQQMFRDRHPAHRRESLPSLVARLVFDSRRPALASAVRGDPSASLQAVYATDDHDVDVWQERLADGNWYLIGQILPKDGRDAITPRCGVMTGANGMTLFTETREGEFFISEARAGRYELRLDLDDTQILLSDVMVGAQRV